MKPTFWNFVKRYARLLILWAIFVILGRLDELVLWCGHVFYIVELVLSCIVSALFIRHIFFRSTVDAFSLEDDNNVSPFRRTWDAIPVEDKLKYSIFIIAVFYLGACWIAASIAK